MTKRKYGSEAVDEITRLIDEALETGHSPDYRPINAYAETKQCVDNDGNVRVSSESYDMDTELMAPVLGPPAPNQTAQWRLPGEAFPEDELIIQPLVTTSGSWRPPPLAETDRELYRRLTLRAFDALRQTRQGFLDFSAEA